MEFGLCNSAEGREEPLRAGKNTFFDYGGPRRTATATSFCPRRATRDREERQRQLLFVHEGPRRAAKNGNGNFFLSTKGHEGPRRTATTTSASFCPRRATRDRKNGNGRFFLSTKGRQRQEGPLGTAKNGNGRFFLSTKGHEGPRRTATATSFCPLRATKDHEERQRQLQLLFVHEGPLRAAKNGNGSFFLSAEGHGEHLLWLRQIMVVGHED